MTWTVELKYMEQKNSFNKARFESVLLWVSCSLETMLINMNINIMVHKKIVEMYVRLQKMFQCLHTFWKGERGNGDARFTW